MAQLYLGLSHLHEHFSKFNHSFQCCINPCCSCGIDIESTSYFFLHCLLFDDKRITLKLIEANESFLIETLLFGNSLFDLKKKKILLS